MEKELTFTVTDALLSPIGLSILSGAGLFKAADETKVHVHKTATASIDADGIIDLTDALESTEFIDPTAPIFVSSVESDGSITGALIEGLSVIGATDKTETDVAGKRLYKSGLATGNVFCDFYVTKASAKVSEIQITADSFGGNFYVEASTLFRAEEDGKDYPAEITIPNVKVQSNFTFSMASSGDPSTFDFTMDAMPGYTMFDKTNKVMCVIQVVEDTEAGSTTSGTVMGHNVGVTIAESAADSNASKSGESSTTA